MFFKIHVRRYEIGLWFRHGDLHRVLPPGEHRGPSALRRHDRVEVIDRLPARFEHKLLDVLAKAPLLLPHLRVLELGDTQRALVWKDGRLGWVLGPGRHAFWNDPADLTVETFDVDAFAFDHPKAEAVLAFRGAALHLDGVRVASHERVLLYRQGALERELGPGLFVYWRGACRAEWKSVDLREQVLDVSGQEIMTADKLTLRVNLVLTYRVTDARKSVESAADTGQSLYRDAQLLLREAVGGRSLDRLLADKDAVSDELRAALAPKAASRGLSVTGLGLRDVILPGDMKAILNEVILAQKQSEAQLIRRREETAAARSQANTAKLLADHPQLARMKELEALQEILKGTKATFLLGRGDVAEQVRSLVQAD